MNLINQKFFRDSHEFLDEVLQSAGICFWTYDHAADSLLWGSQLLDMLGFEEGNGPKSLTEWFDLIHPEDQRRARACLEAIFRDSSHLHEVQYRYRHRQGHWVWLHDRGRIIKQNPDGSPLLTAGTICDITQLKQAEATAERTESRFGDLVQQLPVGVYTLATSGTVEQSEFTFVSDRLCQLVGLTKSAMMQDASIAFNLAIPDDYGRLIKAIQTAYSTKEPFHFEGQFQVHDELRWLSISSHPTVQSDEETLWDGIVIDITERKRAERAEKSLRAELELRVTERTAELAAKTAQVQSSEEWLRHALEASCTGVLDWNMKTGSVIYLFPEEMLHGDHLPGDEAFALWKSLIHPNDLNRVLTYIAGRFPSADIHEMEYRLRFVDGRYHWVLAKGKVIERDAAGNPVRIIGTHINVNARKEVELQNRRLAFIIEASSDLIATASPEKTIDYVNAAYRKVLGYGETPLENIHIRDTHPEWAYRLVTQKAIPTAMREGSWQGDTVFLTQDGLEKELSQLILAPRNPKTGEVEFLATICRDMTERRRLEDQIRDRNDALELADRRKTKFLATLAHELRNPMSPLLIAAQVLQESAADKAKLPWIADLIERQVRHLSRLVDDLLDVSRITQGKVQLNRQIVDLSVLLPEAIQMALSNIDAAHHQLSLKLPEEPIHVNGDPVRLVQVFTNLLNNAAKFTDPGGQLALTLEQREDQAVITVSDNGCGIESAHLNQVFEPFAQVDRSAHRANGGLGVGLYLSKQLIELHNGTIKAHSQGPHRGSEFVVLLPLVHVSTEAAITEHPSPQVETPSCIRRILVVDDNHDAALSLELLLQKKGHDVRVAHDGHSALECVQVFNPEVVLLDIGMPDIDGYEVCRQIRATARGKRMVICAVTGWGQQEDKQRAYEAGFDGHLTKPVKLDDILSQVNNYRGHYGPRK